MTTHTKYKVGDKVTYTDTLGHAYSAEVMFVSTAPGTVAPYLIVYSRNNGYSHTSGFISEDALIPAPVKVTSEKYRRLLYKYAYTGETRVSYVLDDVSVRNWEKDPHFIGWVDKDWITSEIEVTPKG
jgi:hypothetical protein